MRRQNAAHDKQKRERMRYRLSWCAQRESCLNSRALLGQPLIRPGLKADGTRRNGIVLVVNFTWGL